MKFHTELKISPSFELENTFHLILENKEEWKVESFPLCFSFVPTAILKKKENSSVDDVYKKHADPGIILLVLRLNMNQNMTDW